MIFLGKLPDMDPNEFWPGAEKAAAHLGGSSFGSGADPLSKKLVEVSALDVNHDGFIDTNDGLFSYLAEPIQHDADGDGIAAFYRVDSTFIVNSTEVTFRNADGSTETLCIPVRVMQDTAGNTFLMPPPKGASAAEVEALTTRPIVSVSFPQNPACYDLTHFGIFTDRHCFPCFARGTMIETEHGPLAVEDLRLGMRVATRDNGLQALRWIGSRVLGSKALGVAPQLRPIRIAAGALGKGLPRRALIVSPQHRILVRSRIAQKMFGTAEVLVAAKQLCQLDGIDIAEDLDEVTYVHFLFDSHQIVWANGAESESLLPGPEALRSVGPAAVAEIYAIFPELASPEYSAPAARELVSGRLGRKLAVRHSQNGKPLLM